MMDALRGIAVLGIVAVASWGCATSPTGRSQLILVPNSEMNAMGAQAFTELKSQTPTSTDPALNAYVKCIAVPITRVSADRTGVKDWEIVVFKDDTPNAFALPGGKIGVHTGILKVARTDAQLAAVLGHEVGHVIARHGAERMSQGLAAEGGLALIDAFVLGKSVSPNQRGFIMGALGLGAQVGVLLPFGRTQESEADLIGLDLMAHAAFDPRQSVDLWVNMGKAAGGAGPPEFLSTHPSGTTRIEDLKQNIPDAMPAYEKARAAGKTPQCKRP